MAKYNKVVHEVIRAITEKLVNTSMKPDQDPGDFFMEKTHAGAELAKLGEPISDRRFKDFFVQGVSYQYKDI